MRTGVVFGLSVLVHGAVLALVWILRPRPERLPPEVVEVTLVEPMEVAFVEPSPAPHVGVGAGVGVSVGDRRGARSPTLTPTLTPTTGTGTGHLSMRGPEAPAGPELRPSSVLEHIAARGELPSRTARSGFVDNAPNGGAVVRDPITTVTVERDGTAHFHDKPDFEIRFALPHPSVDGVRHGLGAFLDSWRADPEGHAGTRAGPKSELPVFDRALPGQCDRWGDAMCDTSTPVHTDRDADSIGFTIFEGKADITSYLMRKLVGDPNSSRKRLLLDATRDERVDRGGAYRAEQLARSAELMHRNLERLWLATLDPAARRQALFELWDESGEGDGPLGEAGQRARAEVIGWIRAHAIAYPPDELAALAARRHSLQPFEP